MKNSTFAETASNKQHPHKKLSSPGKIRKQKVIQREKKY